MSKNTNANLSISPNVMQMLGRKLYSSHPLIIVVRELLQNSVDACKRRGVNPEISIEIRIDSYGDNPHILVNCTDNGEGMTSDILLNKFLCLGESGKRDNQGGTGGFGIAKAAIMSNPFWDVHTHDLYMSVDLLGNPLMKVNYIDGTKINVRINEKWYASTIKAALSTIYMSNVSINLTVIENDKIVISDNSAGLHQDTLTDYESEMYNISLCEEFNPANHDYTNMSALTVFRLNGSLVQFAQNGSNRKTNVIVDIFSDLLPTDDNYPFSMSRETIASSLQWQVNSKVSEYDENPLTTSSKLRNSNLEKNMKKRNGLYVKGETFNEDSYCSSYYSIERNCEDDIAKNNIVLENVVSFLMNASNDFSKNMTSLGKEVNEITKDDIVEEMYSNSKIAEKIKKFIQFESLPAVGKLQSIVMYRTEKPTTEEKRILRLWAGILALTANVEDHFGIGITGSNDEYASRFYNSEDDTYYYLINTQKIMEENHQMDALIHRLHMLACHECEHFEQYSHNEFFTSGMDSIYAESISAILANMAKLRSIIRNNYS